MGFDCVNLSELSLRTTQTKVRALELTLEKSLTNFKEVAVEFDQLYIELENYKSQYFELKEKCESNKCNGSETLKKIIESKDNIIQSITPILRKLNETNSLNLPIELERIICSDSNLATDENKLDVEILNKEPLPETVLNIKADISIQDMSFKDESVCEIEGTPTGRISPIIQSRVFRNNFTSSSPDVSDKKKCPTNWPNSDKKSIKLSYGNSVTTPQQSRRKPNTKLRQLRLITSKEKKIVDLTSSVALTGGLRSVRTDSVCNNQVSVKNEPLDSDETILPSPTSSFTNFPMQCKSIKNSPSKFRKPQSCAKVIMENIIKTETDCENMPAVDKDAMEMEESINLLKGGFRFKANLVKQLPLKEVLDNEGDDDVTHCDLSLSMLQDVHRLEENNKQIQSSPQKAPLVENINVVNMDTESSMSVLAQENLPIDNILDDINKRKTKEGVKPIYKEAIPRKKVEKLSLPGWSCEECKNFYAELYKDDIETLAAKMNECSKHRGRNNPVRPRTPPGFWCPRWEVPVDTEEFNRRNDAL